MIDPGTMSWATMRRFVAYGFASVAALGVDLASFYALMAAGVAAPAAAAGGYTIGIIAHWFASSRFVFSGRVAEAGRQRTEQKGLFVASALVGLVMTWGIVGAGTAFGIDPGLAKLAAIGASFVATFLIRHHFVFTERLAQTPAKS
ncbi:GtrA family protein [Croceicoccus bisphenolivorans]|uniref:GtrA family protein n=1 Tax=Croceicoccus bisphenolivorans TaxID=1783232 RepID=UPI00082D09C2|nr:GtrA family protein [Croceicoccus bisphenolivorans]